MPPELEKLVPAGMDARRELGQVLYALGAALAAAVFCCLIVYVDARSDMYITRNGIRYLNPDAEFPYCAEMAARCVPFFAAAALLMLYKLARYVAYHYQGSRSIYTMRRLPQRAELLRRCLSLPLGGALACLLLFAALTALFCAVYLAVTPADWVRPGQWEAVRRLLLGR